MNARRENPTPPIRGGLKAAPCFLGALRGVWLFAWRSQLSWRQAPALLGWLLILPILVWATVPSKKAWVQRPPPSGDAIYQLNRFSGQLNRMKLPPLDKDQNRQIIDILRQEHDRVETEMRGDSGPETSVEDQQKLLEAAQLRVDDQARSLLDDRQFGVFRTVNQDFTQNRVRRAAQPRWNRTAPFYRWLVDFYFLIILPLGCARSCGGLIREELQNDTLGFLTTRPVKRAVLVILKYLCQTAWLQIIALLEALLLFGAGRLREVPGLGALLPLFLAVQFLAVPAWSALGLMLGQITRRYLALALVYGLVVELGIGSIPTNINSLSLMRHLETLLSRNAALESIFQWTPDGALFAAGMLVLAAGVFLSAAALLFTFLEYHAGTEMHK